MLQQHLSNQQFNCPRRCGLYQIFDGISDVILFLVSQFLQSGCLNNYFPIGQTCFQWGLTSVLVANLWRFKSQKENWTSVARNVRVFAVKPGLFTKHCVNVITFVPYEYRGVSNGQQCECLYNSLNKQTTKKTPLLRHYYDATLFDRKKIKVHHYCVTSQSILCCFNNASVV